MTLRPADAATLLVVTLLWGLNWAAVKTALAGIPPWTLRAVGIAAGAALLAAIVRATGRRLGLARDWWGAIAIAGLLNVAGFNLLVVFAQLVMPTSKAAILTFTMPLWAALFSRIWLGDPLTPRRLAALGIGLAGLLVLSAQFWVSVLEGASPWGLAFVLGAAISWAAGTVYLKAARIPGDPLVLTVWQLAVGALVAGLGMLAFETPRIDTSNGAVLIALGYHIVGPIAFCYAAWFTLTRRIPIVTASLATLMIPVFGVLGSVVVLGETPGLVDLAGFALILVALAIEATRPQETP